MAENTKNVEFKNPHPELPVREPILKLGKMITDRAAIKLGLEKLTADDPEYWGLAAICTDEMAEVALKMGVRKPKTLPELVKITGMDEKYLEELLNKMAFNGVIEYNWENPKHEKQYVLPMFVPGSAEFANMNDTVLEEHPEMGRFFERMSRIPLEGLTHMVPPGGAGIGMHIPRQMSFLIYGMNMGLLHICPRIYQASMKSSQARWLHYTYQLPSVQE